MSLLAQGDKQGAASHFMLADKVNASRGEAKSELLALTPTPTSAPPTPTATAAPATATPVSPLDVRVTSQIVKRIPGGKFRYFFDVRNFDQRPCAGDVVIYLLNRQPGITNGSETFSTKRQSSGTSVHPSTSISTPGPRVCTVTLASNSTATRSWSRARL
jgi:hypothetical protein